MKRLTPWPRLSHFTPQISHLSVASPTHVGKQGWAMKSPRSPWDLRLREARPAMHTSGSAGTAPSSRWGSVKRTFAYTGPFNPGVSPSCVSLNFMVETVFSAPWSSMRRPFKYIISRDEIFLQKVVYVMLPFALFSEPG